MVLCLLKLLVMSLETGLTVVASLIFSQEGLSLLGQTIEDPGIILS